MTSVINKCMNGLENQSTNETPSLISCLYWLFQRIQRQIQDFYGSKIIDSHGGWREQEKREGQKNWYNGGGIEDKAKKTTEKRK